jgi:hypothetical protein
MVGHIFRKDWKLAWVFVLIVSAVHWTGGAILYKLGLFGEDPMLGMLAEAVPMLALFGSMFLIGAIVHLDAIPGVRQDWLVRPVSRSTLVIEKLIFVVVMVNGPIFVEVLIQGLANRFSLHVSLAAAVWQVAFLLFAFTLPLFSFASTTQNITQAFILGCGCSFLMVAFNTIARYLNSRARGTLEPVTWSGIGWIGETTRFALIIVAAATILSLQYFRRRTFLSRVMVLFFGFVILGTQFLPWRPTFAIERRFSAKPNTGMSVAVAFDPQLGKFRSPSGLGASSEQGRRYSVGEHASMFLPLRIAGIHAEAFLLTDHVDVRLVSDERKIKYHGIGEALEVIKEGPEFAEGPIYQEIQVPASVYREMKDQPVRAEVEYSLTLFGLNQSYSIPALGGDERMPNFGWCQTKMNEAETAIELRCMQPGKGPTCATLFLENEKTGERSPERSPCHGDYSPYSGWYTGDNIARFGANIPFRDPSGLAKFPVDGPQLPNSRVVIRVYEPEDHFTRSLVIPQIKLRDWEAQ